MKSNRIFIIVVGLIICLTTTASADNRIVVNIDLPECPYYSSRLDYKLYDHLSIIDQTEIVYPDSVENAILSDSKTLLFEDILEIGTKYKGRYLIDISIDRIDIEKRKVTVIPVFFYRYRVYGVLTGKIKIIDLARKRVLETRDIEFEVKAADQWQLIDDDPDDPALLLAADKRVLLLDKLDDKAALELFKNIKKMTRGAFKRG